jgi:rod shape-determining protein MreD
MTLFYLLLGFFLFFLQHLSPLLAPWRPDLLTLYLVYATLRLKVLSAVLLALFCGLVLDCYGLAPLGLHAALLLTAVLGTAASRRRLNFLYVLPQIAGVGLIMALQAAIMVGLLHLLLPVPVVHPAMLRQIALQLATTALSAPLVLGVFRLLETGWQRWVLKKSPRPFLAGLGL